MAIDINVKVTGGLFSKDISKVVRAAVYEEVIDKLATRMERGGKGIGAKRNTISRPQREELQELVKSTRIWPRTKGTSWQRKNIAIAKSLVPRAAKKYAERVVRELGA